MYSTKIVTKTIEILSNQHADLNYCTVEYQRVNGVFCNLLLIFVGLTLPWQERWCVINPVLLIKIIKHIGVSFSLCY
jgi:hypothetical protein